MRFGKPTSCNKPATTMLANVSKADIDACEFESVSSCYAIQAENSSEFSGGAFSTLACTQEKFDPRKLRGSYCNWSKPLHFTTVPAATKRPLRSVAATTASCTGPRARNSS